MASRLSRLWARLRKPAADEPVVHPLEHPTYHDIVWENAIEAFQDSPDEIEPPDESGYPPVDPVFDLPPLEFSQYDRDRLKATKAELMLKAARIKREQDAALAAASAKARGRRRFVTVAMSASLMLVAIAGVSAATGERIDLDRLLGVLWDREERKTPDNSAGERVLPHAITRGETQTSELLTVPGPDGGPPGVAGAFLNRGADICLALSRPLPSGVNGGALLGCVSSRMLQERLERQAAFLAGTSVGPVTVVLGYAALDVEELSIHAGGERLLTQLTSLWKPEGVDVEPFRVVVAAYSPAAAADGLTQEESEVLTDFGRYDVKAHLTDPMHQIVDVSPEP